MKLIKNAFLIIGLLIITNSIIAQTFLPNISLSSSEGNRINVQEIGNDGIVVISFWATWCVPCIKELDAINDVYPDWQEETNVKLIAVSIDDSRTISRVNPMVNGKGWEYEILYDTNHEFKRALNIVSVPYVIIVKNGKIVYKHSGYTSGSEFELYEEIKKLSE